MRRAKRFFLNYWPIVVYACIVVFVFGSAMLPKPGYLLFGDDIHRQYVFFREFLLNMLKQGVLPFWNPYQFSGYPFLANPQWVNVFYLPSMLFFLIPPSQIFSWYVGLHIVFAMTGMYWLCRYHIILAPIPSFCAGVIFGLSGFFSARIWAGHVDIIAAASFIPWVFGLSQRAGVGKRRDIVPASIVLCLQLLAGYQTITLLTIDALMIMTLFLCMIHRSFFPALRILSVILLGVGLSAIQLVPQQEFFHHTIRSFTFPYSWNANGSLWVDSFKQLVDPFYFGDQSIYHGAPPNYQEHAMYIGKIGLGLALFTIFVFVMNLIIRRRTVALSKVGVILLFTVISIFSLWISLGYNAGIDLHYIIWQLVPFYHYLRFPPRHLVLFVFAASVLSAMGIQLLRQKVLQLAFVFLIIFEMVPFAKHFIDIKQIPQLRHDEKLIKLVTQDTQPYRLLENFGVWVSPRDSLDFNSAMVYGVYSTTGYDPSILRNYYEFIDAANKNPTPSILMHDVQVPYLDVYSRATDFLNIKYILHPPAYDSIGGKSSDRFTLLRDNKSRDYRLYENKNVLPRFFLVQDARIFSTRTQVAEAIRTGEVDFSKTVLLDKSKINDIATDVPKDCDVSRQNVSIVSYGLNTISLRATSPCKSYLVSSEVVYPGWDAYIDTLPAQVLEGNLAFRVIVIPEGLHTVTYSYSPRIYLLGLVITVVSLLICIRLWLRPTSKNIVPA